MRRWLGILAALLVLAVVSCAVLWFFTLHGLTPKAPIRARQVMVVPERIPLAGRAEGHILSLPGHNSTGNVIKTLL